MKIKDKGVRLLTVPKLILECFVSGKPATQGSKKWVGGHTIIDSCKRLPMWRELIKLVASSNYSRRSPSPQPITLRLTFCLNRPKSTSLKAKPIKRPDLLKMARAVEDALSGIVYNDDSQITTELLCKRYRTPKEEEGVWITAFETP